MQFICNENTDRRETSYSSASLKSVSILMWTRAVNGVVEQELSSFMLYASSTSAHILFVDVLYSPLFLLIHASSLTTLKRVFQSSQFLLGSMEIALCLRWKRRHWIPIQLEEERAHEGNKIVKWIRFVDDKSEFSIMKLVPFSLHMTRTMRMLAAPLPPKCLSSQNDLSSLKLDWLSVLRIARQYHHHGIGTVCETSFESSRETLLRVDVSWWGGKLRSPSRRRKNVGAR